MGFVLKDEGVVEYPLCVDSDHGIIDGVRGTAYGYLLREGSIQNVTDECIDFDKLREYYCVNDSSDHNGTLRYELIVCLRGCVDGICY